jgi:sugar phosphate isomerase/epimerase
MAPERLLHPGTTPSGTPLPGITYSGVADEAAADPAEQIAAIKALGWTSIELRSVRGVAVADLDRATVGELADGIAEAGLTVSCVDSRIANWERLITGRFEDDLDELAVLTHHCRRLGTSFVRIMSYPNEGLDEPDWERRVIERIPVLAAKAADAGLTLLHENCAGWAGSDPSRMRRLVEEVDGPGLRLLFDIGNGIAYGYQAYDLLAEVADLVEHVHIKDARGGPAHPEYTLPGEGDSRVADCLNLLLDRGYHGVWSIEPHLQVRPHEQRTHAGLDGVDLFVSYGRCLERLVAEHVTPHPTGGP